MVEGDLFDEKEATGGKVSLRSLLFEYKKYWYIFVVSIAICVVVAFFHIRYTVTQYYVATTLLIKDETNGSGFTANPVASEMQLFGPGKKIEDEIIVLKSKSLMERVLRELSFNTLYFLDGRVQDMEVYEKSLPLKLIISKLHPSAYNKKIFIYPKDDNSFELGEMDVHGDVHKVTYSFGQQISRPYAVFTVIESTDPSTKRTNEKVIVVFQDVAALAEKYSNLLTVAPVNKSSNVLNLSLVDPVSQRSIDILNKLTEVYRNEAVEDKNIIASNSLDFIDERLSFLTAELTDVEKNVEAYKRQNNLTDVSSDAALYLKSADDYNKKLAEFDIQIELLRSIENYLGDKHVNKVELVPSSLNIEDPTLLILISKFNELQLERQRMQRTTNSNNPLMINLNEQVNNLRMNIGENIKNLINGLLITRQNLIASSAEFEYRKKMVPAMERELLEINRQQGVKEGLYLYLLQKREESALSLAASVSNFRIIDPPRVIHPINPNKMLLYVIAVLLGLLVPFSIIYLVGMLNDKIMSTKDIATLTPTPILGEVARNDTKQYLVVSHNANSPLVEMFRLIRMNLQFAIPGTVNKVMLITSSMSGEGKSFFSINIAASLVLTGKRVVIVGMDLRKPVLTKAIKLSEGPGVTNFLTSDDYSVFDIVRPSNVLNNLFVVASGPVSPCPTELMISQKMKTLFEELRLMFDYIIIDSAPIGLVADAYTLAPYIDSTIYIVRRNSTARDQITIIDKVYRERKLNYPMIVLNDAVIGKGQKYGYGYSEKESKKKVRPALKKAVVSETEGDFINWSKV